MRILLIEPDAPTAQAVELMLKAEAFNVYTTDQGEEGVELGKLYDYDVVVTALNLSDIPGHNVVKRLRDAKISAPIMVLSGRCDVEDKVKALDLGADDYLTKPFHRDELVSRIHALVRRSKGHSVSIIETGNVAVNLSTKTVTVDGIAVHFTGKEYAMMELLSLRKGATITKEMFLNHLYGGRDEPELKIIDVFICKIRKKLREAGGHDVETIWGRGYVLRDAPKVTRSPNLTPEIRDRLEVSTQDGPDWVSTRTFMDRRNEAMAQGKITSPSIVPEAGL